MSVSVGSQGKAEDLGKLLAKVCHRTCVFGQFVITTHHPFLFSLLLSCCMTRMLGNTSIGHMCLLYNPFSLCYFNSIQFKTHYSVPIASYYLCACSLQIQDDLAYLKATAARAQDGQLDVKALDLAISRTERGVAAAAESVLASSQNQVRVCRL